jgi:DNA-binding Lrp family transcriptional regulator
VPFQLDDYDVHILKALLRDSRKSFREISRETCITTPTVKARFNRLANVGFIKSVSPILNFNVVEESIGKSELRKDRNGEEQEEYKDNNQHYQLQLQTAKSNQKRNEN